MRTVELRGLDRIVPKSIYRLDKVGLKTRNKCVLKISKRLIDYIGRKYGAPSNSKWMMGMTYIQY